MHKSTLHTSTHILVGTGVALQTQEHYRTTKQRRHATPNHNTNAYQTSVCKGTVQVHMPRPGTRGRRSQRQGGHNCTDRRTCRGTPRCRVLNHLDHNLPLHRVFLHGTRVCPSVASLMHAVHNGRRSWFGRVCGGCPQHTRHSPTIRSGDQSTLTDM